MLDVYHELSPLQELQNEYMVSRATPAEAAENALDAANSNASHNVYLSMDRDRALQEAEDLESRFVGTDKPPLYGVPVSIKDLFDLKGFVTTVGSKFYAERNGRATSDSAVAERLRSQGALLVGKTHLHTIAYGITGQNADYGDCLQPGDATLLTGGSSSGAAASVQEGSAMAAIGTDTGGSIRVPAALCGLAGYRTSVGLALERGLWAGSVPLAHSFDTLGWIFRDLRDGPALAQALFGLSPATIPFERPARIACVPDGFLHDCEAAVLEGFALWRARLAKAGAEVLTVDTAFWEDARSIFAPIQASEAAEYHGKSGSDFSHFGKILADRLTWGASISQAELKHLRERHAEFNARMDTIFSEHDFLIVPCSPTARLLANDNEREVRTRILRYTAPMSLVGTPVVTLPAAGGAGVQLVAARGKDAQLLVYAASLAEKSMDAIG